MLEFCKCGSIKQNGACTKKNCTEGKSRQTEWTVFGHKMTFTKPVDFQYARNMYIKLASKNTNVEKRIVEVDFSEDND